jgi:hypothetical protein
MEQILLTPKSMFIANQVRSTGEKRGWETEDEM